MAIFTILYGNYYPPNGEFELICIEKFARRTWVNFTQQYGKNRQRCQQNKFTMLYGNYCYIFIENFPQKFSPCRFAHIDAKLNAYSLLLQIRHCQNQNALMYLLIFKRLLDIIRSREKSDIEWQIKTRFSKWNNIVYYTWSILYTKNYVRNFLISPCICGNGRGRNFSISDKSFIFIWKISLGHWNRS